MINAWPQRVTGRAPDGTNHRPPTLQNTDRGREHRKAVDEVGRAVNRIDGPHTVTRAAQPLHHFLPDHVVLGKSFGAIPLERTKDTGLKHVDGVLSMPRSTPDSGTSGFSICIGDQPEMDFGGKRNADGQGFAVFGRVTSGMDVVRKIHAAPSGPSTAKDGVSAGDQRLTPPIKILSIRRK